MSNGILSCNLSVSFFEKAPQAIINLSNLYRLFSDLKTGFVSSKSRLLMFNFKNFPPLLTKFSKSFNNIFFGFLACLA